MYKTHLQIFSHSRKVNNKTKNAVLMEEGDMKFFYAC